MADKYLSAAGKRRRLYINTIKAWSELMANICRQKTSSDYSCHPTENPLIVTFENKQKISPYLTKRTDYLVHKAQILVGVTG